MAFTENADVLESHLEGLGGAGGAWQEDREEMCAAHKYTLIYEFNVGRNLQRKQKLAWLSFWKCLSSPCVNEGFLFKVAGNSFQYFPRLILMGKLYISWCQNHGIKKLPNHWWTCCCQFFSSIGYHSNNMTC